MPQLDHISYSTQIFWLLILFTSFYFIILKHILPSILLSIKTRENILNDMFAGNSNYTFEVKSITDNYVKINSDILNEFSGFLYSVGSILNKHYIYLASIVNYSLHSDIIKNNTTSDSLYNEIFSILKP